MAPKAGHEKGAALRGAPQDEEGVVSTGRSQLTLLGKTQKSPLILIPAGPFPTHVTRDSTSDASGITSPSPHPSYGRGRERVNPGGPRESGLGCEEERGTPLPAQQQRWGSGWFAFS